MRTIFLKLFIFSLLSVAFQTDSFKNDQLRYPRVRKAYEDKEAQMLSILNEHKLTTENLQIYLRAFKEEKEIELWGKNKSDPQFQLLKTYKICRSSGDIGPKRKQGDRQVPEGFYYINIFNPFSNFYLSLGINYPNKSDRILGVKGNLGGDIFIHGACVTIGCIPIKDEHIKELYIFCVEAKNNGQNKIPVTIFPTRLSSANFTELQNKNPNENELIGLWTDLKKAYDLFNQNKDLPFIQFMDNGRHEIN
jgi:murein L,D-transpeptidase YafK